MITIALSKGRIFTETMPILKAAGIECSENPESSRKLVFNTNKENIQIIIVLSKFFLVYQFLFLS